MVDFCSLKLMITEEVYRSWSRVFMHNRKISRNKCKSLFGVRGKPCKSSVTKSSVDKRGSLGVFSKLFY